MQKFDRTTFLNFLYTQKNLRPVTAKNYAFFIGKFVRSNQTAEDFANSYSNINSFNNAVKSLKHYYDFLGLPRPNLKCKEQSPDKLIVSPKKEIVLDILAEVEPREVKAYLALCATCGLRPQRLLKLNWVEIDFANSIITINENIKTKHYRPNPLHIDVRCMLEALPKTNDRVFSFGLKRIRESLNKVDTTLRAHDFRDFFYNEARKCSIDRDLVEWLMGHSIGIRAHYLSDEIKQEYSKFEQSFRIL